MNESIPCKECLLVPACRHKSYLNMLYDCALVYEVLYNRTSSHENRIQRKLRKSGFMINLKGIEEIIKPKTWKIAPVGGCLRLVGKDE